VRSGALSLRPALALPIRTQPQPRDRWSLRHCQALPSRARPPAGALAGMRLAPAAPIEPPGVTLASALRSFDRLDRLAGDHDEDARDGAAPAVAAAMEARRLTGDVMALRADVGRNGTGVPDDEDAVGSRVQRRARRLRALQHTPNAPPDVDLLALGSVRERERELASRALLGWRLADGWLRAHAGRHAGVDSAHGGGHGAPRSALSGSASQRDSTA
jgi:hypothetical protein